MSKREIVAREIRRAMLDNPTDGGFNARAAQREKIADQAADAILAALAARQDMVSTDLTTRLRAYAAKFGPIDPERAMCLEAAEEIERLRAAQLRGATESMLDAGEKALWGYDIDRREAARDVWSAMRDAEQGVKP